MNHRLIKFPEEMQAFTPRRVRKEIWDKEQGFTGG
jgi:hypothetical protein